MQTGVEITERFLSDAGGWQALKEARALWEAGKVLSATYEPPLLRGMVRDGVKEYRSGLRIVTRTNIENLCSCRISRERGMVCAHALAVGFQFMKGSPAEVPAQAPPVFSPQRETQQSPLPPGKPRFRLEIEGSLNRLGAKLQVSYEEGKGRDPEAEGAALGRLARCGFSAMPGSGNPNELLLKGERLILQFLAGELPALQREWKIEFGSRFANINENVERVRPRLDVEASGTDWFEFSVSLGTSDGQTFSNAEIQRLLQMGQNHVRLKNGSVAVFDAGMLDELGQAIADCDPRQTRPGGYRIGRAQAGYLQSVLGDSAEIAGAPEWRRWTGLQLQPDTLAPVPLGGLEEVLRPYQKQGVYWMDFLARNGFGGVLADEMGLGKTVQALAFLERLRASQTLPSLIICPSSLVQNWAREAAKFTPDLRVLVLEGAVRHERWSDLPQADIAVTSYALLRRDAARYADFEFAAAILDEAQHIKNPETQNAQAAASLRAQHRLVLTGTPLENSVRDLWSIFNFVMPGYLGSRADFKERYEQPLAQAPIAGDAPTSSVKTRLAKRIRPFLLRRTKREVYKELPEKLQQVLYCELTVRQAELYKALLSESRRQIVELSAGPDQNKARMLMLTALLRLRQTCCDMRLLGGGAHDDVPQAEASAKLELLDELLREAIDGGHRVLIFSQFVSMLKLQKTALEAAEIPYCYLDGQTKDRMAEVDRFQNDPAIPVFLISLKAGGVGLNLTGADTVIHFDPWWNPAVEAQATDRAHRIGQEKVVTAYKLIARGTVEEKLLKLQESKKSLMEAIESEEPVMAGLSTAEIQELLS